MTQPILAAVTFSEVLSWLMPCLCLWGVYEGVTMIWKGKQSHDKGERTGETFWGFVYALAPLILEGMLLKFGAITIPFASSLPF